MMGTLYKFVVVRGLTELVLLAWGFDILTTTPLQRIGIYLFCVAVAFLDEVIENE